MFKKTEKLVPKSADELERVQAQLLAEISQLKGLVTSLGAETERYRQMLLDSAPMLDRYEKTAERIVEQMTITNDAQAARYFELKKRLDSHDGVFRQLGVLINKQPTAAPLRPKG